MIIKHYKTRELAQSACCKDEVVVRDGNAIPLFRVAKKYDELKPVRHVSKDTLENRFNK